MTHQIPQHPRPYPPSYGAPAMHPAQPPQTPPQQMPPAQYGQHPSLLQQQAPAMQYGQSPYAPQQQAPMSGLSIATFVLSFFAGLVAVVLGVFALRQNWVRGSGGSGLAWAGIIIGAVIGVGQIWTFMLLFWAFSRPGS